MNEEFDRVTKTLQAEPSALKQFVMVYGNCDLKGGGLTTMPNMMEPLLFQVFLRACTELGIHPSRAVHSADARPAAADGDRGGLG